MACNTYNIINNDSSPVTVTYNLCGETAFINEQNIQAFAQWNSPCIEDDFTVDGPHQRIIINQNCGTTPTPTPTLPTATCMTFSTISNTSTGAGGIRTQVWEFSGTPQVGQVVTATVYSVSITYTVQSGDTLDDVGLGLRNEINNTTESEWDANGSAPNSGTNGFKPTAGYNLSTNRFTLTLNHQNQFGFMMSLCSTSTPTPTPSPTPSPTPTASPTPVDTCSSMFISASSLGSEQHSFAFLEGQVSPCAEDGEGATQISSSNSYWNVQNNIPTNQYGGFDNTEITAGVEICVPDTLQYVTVVATSLNCGSQCIEILNPNYQQATPTPTPTPTTGITVVPTKTIVPTTTPTPQPVILVNVESCSDQSIHVVRIDTKCNAINGTGTATPTQMGNIAFRTNNNAGSKLTYKLETVVGCSGVPLCGEAISPNHGTTYDYILGYEEIIGTGCTTGQSNINVCVQ